MATSRTQHLKVNESGTRSPSSGNADDYTRQLEQAENQLEKLRIQREQIERQRLEAEEITNRRQQFIDGQIELIEKFEQSVQVLDREIFESRQELKELEEARHTFAKDLQDLQKIDPRKWKKTKMAEEVEQALEVLDTCEADYDEIAEQVGKGRRRGMMTASPKVSGGFGQSFQQGLAFNLPLMIFAALTLLILFLR